MFDFVLCCNFMESCRLSFLVGKYCSNYEWLAAQWCVLMKIIILCCDLLWTNLLISRTLVCLPVNL